MGRIGLAPLVFLGFLIGCGSTRKAGPLYESWMSDPAVIKRANNMTIDALNKNGYKDVDENGDGILTEPEQKNYYVKKLYQAKEKLEKEEGSEIQYSKKLLVIIDDIEKRRLDLKAFLTHIIIEQANPWMNDPEIIKRARKIGREEISEHSSNSRGLYEYFKNKMDINKDGRISMLEFLSYNHKILWKAKEELKKERNLEKNKVRKTKEAESI